MDKNTIDETIQYLIPIKGLNNLAARISVLCKFIENGKSLLTFSDSQISSLREEVSLKENEIDIKVLSKLYKIIDYIEASYVMEKLK